MTGSNILKRTIEHMSAGPFDSAREQAMDILNGAIESCFVEEQNIEHENFIDAEMVNDEDASGDPTTRREYAERAWERDQRTS